MVSNSRLISFKAQTFVLMSHKRFGLVWNGSTVIWVSEPASVRTPAMAKGRNGNFITGGTTLELSETVRITFVMSQSHYTLHGQWRRPYVFWMPVSNRWRKAWENTLLDPHMRRRTASSRVMDPFPTQNLFGNRGGVDIVHRFPN